MLWCYTCWLTCAIIYKMRYIYIYIFIYLKWRYYWIKEIYSLYSLRGYQICTCWLSRASWHIIFVFWINKVGIEWNPSVCHSPGPNIMMHNNSQSWFDGSKKQMSTEASWHDNDCHSKWILFVSQSCINIYFMYWIINRVNQTNNIEALFVIWCGVVFWK